MVRHKEKLSHKKPKVWGINPQEVKSLKWVSPLHFISVCNCSSFVFLFCCFLHGSVSHLFPSDQKAGFSQQLTDISLYKVRAKFWWCLIWCVMWDVWDSDEDMQVLIYSRRISHCWALYHPEILVVALPLSGDHIFCIFCSMGQIFPMTVHHLLKQLHPSIWIGCCWPLCHHLLLETSPFSMKRRSSSL